MMSILLSSSGESAVILPEAVTMPIWFGIVIGVVSMTAAFTGVGAIFSSLAGKWKPIFRRGLTLSTLALIVTLGGGLLMQSLQTSRWIDNATKITHEGTGVEMSRASTRVLYSNLSRPNRVTTLKIGDKAGNLHQATLDGRAFTLTELAQGERGRAEK